MDRVDSRLKGDAKERVIALRKKLTEFDSLKPASLPPFFGATDVGPKAPETFLRRGKTQEAIAPGYLSVLDEQPAQIAGLPNSTGRRTAKRRARIAPARACPSPIATRISSRKEKVSASR